MGTFVQYAGLALLPLPMALAVSVKPLPAHQEIVRLESVGKDSHIRPSIKSKGRSIAGWARKLSNHVFKEKERNHGEL